MADTAPSPSPGQTVRPGNEDWWAVGIGLGIVIAALVLSHLGLSLRWLAVLPPRWKSLGEVTADLATNYPRYLAQFVFWAAVFGGALSALGYRLRDFLVAFVPLYLAAYVIFVLGQWDKAVAYNLEPPLVALFLGLLVANTVGVPARFAAGLRGELYVKVGIVLLGATVPLTLIVLAGPVAVGQAAVVSIATFAVIYAIAVRLGLDRRFAATLGVGGAVCGVSAAIAIAGAVGARRGKRLCNDLGSRVVGDRDDIRAATGIARAAVADRRRGRMDRHVGIRRCGGHCRGAGLWRTCGQSSRHHRHRRPGVAGIHADESAWP